MLIFESLRDIESDFKFIQLIFYNCNLTNTTNYSDTTDKKKLEI